MTNPKKSPTLHVESLGEELSVYDWQRLQMHSLNPTAAAVFELCDGQTSPAQMAKRLEAPEAVVWQSLDELGKARLLSEAPEKPAHYQGMTRQQFLKLGGAVALASIVSIVVPRPAAAQSPAAGAGHGGGGATCPIVRTANVGTAPSMANHYVALNAPITDAEITACAPTQIRVEWSSGIAPTSLRNIRLLQANPSPQANAGIVIQAGDTSPQTFADADIWTGNRPYTFLRFSSPAAGTWDVGTMTITLS